MIQEGLRYLHTEQNLLSYLSNDVTFEEKNM